jgi:hypothetical protein
MKLALVILASLALANPIPKAEPDALPPPARPEGCTYFTFPPTLAECIYLCRGPGEVQGSRCCCTK